MERGKRMTIKEYRKEHGITQGQLAQYLTEKLGKTYTTSLISYAEKGMVDLPKSALDVMGVECREKPFRNPSNEGLGGKWITIPHDEKKCVKSAISQNAYDVLEELKYCTKSHPFNSHDYASSVGCREVNVRSCIRELRLNGIRICSDPSHVGYWLEEKGDKGDYERTRAQMFSRAFRLLEVVKAMDNAQDGQMEWAEGLG